MINISRKKAEVDIIIPIYRGIEESQTCIESVLSTLPEWAQLVVINDASPELELTDWLRKKSKSADFLLLENEKNLGFVATVNRGMRLNLQRDILLLNSDTEVANDWLSRLREGAYKHQKTASITPFSNNATICSFPNFCEDNQLFGHLSVEQLDHCFKTCAFPENLVEIPTAVGFCMYIRRDCLNAIGYFDEVTFGYGYGEENDWCIRALKAKWRNYQQLNVFVYHKGAVSFQKTQNIRKDNALKLLNEKHPEYTDLIVKFIQKDPALLARFLVTLFVISTLKIPKILLITHKLGGGIEHHLQDLAYFYQDKAWFLKLSPDVQADNMVLSFGMTAQKLKIDMRFNLSKDYEALVFLLKQLGVGHIHIHSNIQVHPKIFDLYQALNCDYDVTIHDYALIYENPRLTDKEERFIEHVQPNDGVTVYQKNQTRELLNNAQRIIFPSVNAFNMFAIFGKELELILRSKSVIAYHPDYELTEAWLMPHCTFKTGRPLRVLMLGVLRPEKGARVLEEVAMKINPQLVEFHLLGYTYEPLKNVKTYGPYQSSALEEKIMEISPDVIWYPAQCPETYSYTLSEGLVRGFPIVATNIGAFSERLHQRPMTYLLDWKTSSQDWCLFWETISKDPKQLLIHRAESYDFQQSREITPFFYTESYLNHEKWTKNSEIKITELINIIDKTQLINNTKMTKKEQLLQILLACYTSPGLNWFFKFIPLRLLRLIKGKLSARSYYEIKP